jgi:Kef-type K+ transport system membrane component KefB
MVVHLLLAVAVIIATTRAVGIAGKRIGQPAVMGELAGGILLGPSFLGWVAPSWAAALFPPEVMPALRVHAQAGVVLFMFLVGLELDLRVVRRSGTATIAISHASIVLPFVLGLLLAGPLHDRLSTGVPFLPFALFLGVSLSVTAFPVLARILRDQGLSRTRMGRIALACAAVDDATAWCLLAVVVSIAETGTAGAIRALPSVARAHIGHYAVFAAFFAGAVVPSGRLISAARNHQLQNLVAGLMLPVFFAFSGMRTEIGLLTGLTNWALCVLIILVACAGKFGGGALASRLVGFGWRDAAALGVLMNTRGLVELIVLNIGLDLGIISPTLFTMLVVMALVTTFMTSPLLARLLRHDPWTVESRT